MLDIEVEVLTQYPLEVVIEEHVGGTGDADYNRLINKPVINGREIRGDFDLRVEDAGICFADNFDIEDMFK